MTDNIIHHPFGPSRREPDADEPDPDERTIYWAQLLVQKCALMQLLALEAQRSPDPAAKLAGMERRVRALIEGTILSSVDGAATAKTDSREAARRHALREAAWLFEGIRFPARPGDPNRG
jgi:hypothetical protein